MDLAGTLQNPPNLDSPSAPARRWGCFFAARKTRRLGRVLNRQDACLSDLLGGQVPGFFKFTVNLLLNSMGSHAHETCLRVAGSDGFADLESPIPQVLIYLANGKFNAPAVHLQPSIRPAIKLAETGSGPVQNRTAFEISG
jgi:hypothetical protein